jgi:hypothetical protein
MDFDDAQIKKALIAFSIEKSLLENDYNCYIPDCYEHPEYLKRILSDLYGDGHVAIVNSIKENLRDFSNHSSVQKFLMALE